MKLLMGILICLCMSIETGAVAAPLDKSVQVDVVMSKITTLLQANKEAEALPYFQQLEAMDTPLPESFYFYYIDALDKSGDANNALSRAEAYLSRYGKKGKYYGKVVAIMSRLSIQADKEAKEKAAESDRRAKQYAEEKKRYDENMAACRDHEYWGHRASLTKARERAFDKCYDKDRRNGGVFAYYESQCSEAVKIRAQEAIPDGEWCGSKYYKPTPP